MCPTLLGAVLLLASAQLTVANHAHLNASAMTAYTDDADTCVDIGNQTDKCQFVKDNCDDPSYFHYLQTYYCQFHSYPALWFVIFIPWMLMLLVLLGDTADDFFCDTLESLTDITKMPPTVAGVTFLAFGNGSPDVFSAIAAFSGSGGGSDIGLSALVGAGVFVTTVVTGAVAWTTPERIHRWPFIRDIVCYLVSLLFLMAIFLDGKVSLFEAVGFVCLYLVYVIVVLGAQCCRKNKEEAVDSPEPDEGRPRLQRTDTPNFLDFNDIGSAEAIRAEMHSHKQGRRSRENSAEGNAEELYSPLLGDAGPPPPRHPRNDNPVTLIWMWLKKFLREEWAERGWIGRVVWIPTLPFIVARTLTIPLVEEETWNKHYAMACCLFAPVFAVFIIGFWDTKIGPIPLVVFAELCGVACFVLVGMKTSMEELPHHRWPFALAGFAMSIVWIFVIANELVDLLLALGQILNISNVILGLTVLAWGNSIADLAADVAIARSGKVSMAIAGAFSGPMFNLMMGLGLALTLSTISSYPEPFHFTGKIDVVVSCAFLIVSLLGSLVVVAFSGWTLTKPYAVGLVVLYIIFMVVSFLLQLGIIPDKNVH